MKKNIVTTFDYTKNYSYFQALTKAKPNSKSIALWYRLPQTLEWNIWDKKKF